MTDGRCRFGLRAKPEMVARGLAGEHARAIARSIGCSPSTVLTARDYWLGRERGRARERAWCAPRRPVPRSCPWALSAEAEQAIRDPRAKSNGADAVDLVDRPASLDDQQRAHVSWREPSAAQRAPQTTRRYEWAVDLVKARRWRS